MHKNVWNLILSVGNRFIAYSATFLIHYKQIYIIYMQEVSSPDYDYYLADRLKSFFNFEVI